MLEGRLVNLTPLDAADISDGYVGWLNDPAVFRFLGTKFGQTRSSVQQYVERFRAPNFLAGIIVRESGAHVGNIAMHSFEPVHRLMELGILIGADQARGKGYGREACALAIGFAFDHLGVHKVTAGTVAENQAMAAVFTSLGFAIEGRLREHYLLENRRLDMIRFGLLRHEFTPERQGRS